MPDGNWITEFAKVAGLPGLLLLYMYLRDRELGKAMTEFARELRGLTTAVGRLTGVVETLDRAE